MHLPRELGKPVVVFDWDGTLVDSMTYKRANLQILFADELSLDGVEVAKLHRRYSGVPRRALFEAIVSDLRGQGLSDLDFDALSVRYTTMNIECSREAKVFPDAVEAVDRLRAAGTRLYVSSSTDPVELEAAVSAVGLQPAFEACFGSEPGFSKGAEHLAHIAKLESCALEEMLFVGDDDADMTLARDASVEGVKIVREPGEEPPKGPQLELLTQLLELVTHHDR